jgi:hypothetical protein
MIIARNAEGFEQIVMAEVLIPNTPNTYGDIMTEAAIREAAYAFMIAGLNSKIILDIEHDNVDITGDAYIIESFIAREGDPDFIKGSWVIAVKIESADIWQRVVAGDLNGFSFEALAMMTPVTIENLRPRIVTGITAPDLIDGHTHAYAVTLDALNRPLYGSTSMTDGHEHTISRHTITDAANGHTHRFDVLTNGEI